MMESKTFDCVNLGIFIVTVGLVYLKICYLVCLRYLDSMYTETYRGACCESVRFATSRGQLHVFCTRTIYRFGIDNERDSRAKPDEPIIPPEWSFCKASGNNTKRNYHDSQASYCARKAIEQRLAGRAADIYNHSAIWCVKRAYGDSNIRFGYCSAFMKVSSRAANVGMWMRGMFDQSPPCD